MKIFKFDTKRGLYHFEVDDLTTTTHSHPVVEVIYAEKGFFKLSTNEQSFEGLTFAIIHSNTPHQLISEECTTQILMIESHNHQLKSFLSLHEIEFDNGIHSGRNQDVAGKFFAKLLAFSQENDLKTPKESRVKKCLEIIEEQEVSYQNLISKLTSEVCLSKSRLSHLFKEHIGVSVKNYLVWNRLKQAFDQYLNSNVNLTEASVQSDFYDQAHLTNAFKSALGIKPSQVYNSRILQS